jgi:hypothetical protein
VFRRLIWGHRRPSSHTNTSAATETNRDGDEEQGVNGDTAESTAGEPLPLISTSARNSKDQRQEPGRWIVFLWGISTFYAIFYSFEMTFLYVNERWVQLLGIQLLLSSSDVFTWIQLVACCKYGVTGCYSLTQTCVGIKLLHVLFNMMMESRASVTSVRHWMFLLEDSTYLWCSRYWLQAQPRILLSVKGIALLLMGAVSCSLIMYNLTSMNRITRL